MSIVVVGAGAAGLMAAISAASLNKSVILVEKNEKSGKKIYITGKGRCNITNACNRDDFFENIVSNPRFLYSAFDGFSNRDMYAFLEENGLPLKIERGERVFPDSDKSSDVIRTLESKARELGVDIRYNTKVIKILSEETDGTKRVAGVETDRGEKYYADEIAAGIGREGSDYSAAVFAFCLDASKMVIWKDVPGFLNADPHFFNNTIKIDQMPYNEAIELSYHGASVIHPKTVKPLQNKEIPLYVKSFLTPEAEGSIVGPFKHLKPSTPLYIIRPNQTLLSIATRDFSFIAEDGLQQIFGHFASAGIRINMMQNSALSFSACIDHNELLLHELIEHLNPSYNVRYNSGLHLITIRYYTQEIIDHIVNGRTILLEQRSRITEQVVVDAND